MKVFILVLFCFFFLAGQVQAIENPLSRPNNKVGIHILDPNEVSQVPELVNSQGGDWGWVTVVLRDDDRDRIKWQKFMDICREKHLIPIVRLASVMTPQGWERPSLYTSLDAANFLNDLSWPTKNRYVVVYNEPNHASEWGGRIDPGHYAYILKYTAQIFKARNEDFFILPAGLDAAAPNSRDGTHMSIYRFLDLMVASQPGIFAFIDGWTSHAYPNPGFSQSPWETSKQSIVSYRHELAYLAGWFKTGLPVFITETGWEDRIGEEKVAEYYQLAFENIWKDQSIVAITPFLMSGQGPFSLFSFVRADGSKKPAWEKIRNIAKVSGSPGLAVNVLGQATQSSPPNLAVPSPNLNLPLVKWNDILLWLWNL